MDWFIPHWRLVAMMPVVGDDGLFWIVATNPNKEYCYVIAKYRSGAMAWNHGDYFDNEIDALEYWANTTTSKGN